jgi:hypothetical protein
VNSYSMNGIVKEDLDISNGLMELIGREQYLITNHYKNKKISDKTKSIFSAILNDGNAYPRYHPLLEEKNIKYVDFNTPKGANLLKKLDFYLSENKEEAGGVEVDVDGNTVKTVNSENELEKERGYVNTTMISIPPTLIGYQSAASAIQFVKDLAPKNTQRLSISFQLTHKQDESLESKKREIQAIAFIILLQKKLQIFENRDEILNTLYKVFTLFGEGVGINDVLTFLSNVSATAPLLGGGSENYCCLGKSDIDELKKILTDDRHTGVESSIKHALDVHALFSAVVGYPAADKEENSGMDVVVVYNSRVLIVRSGEGKPPLHELDLVLLSSIEAAKVSNGVQAALELDTKPVSSNDFLTLISFCGSYAKTGKRFNLKAILKQFRIISDNVEEKEPSYVFHVTPPETPATPQRDLGLSMYIIVDPLTTAGQRASSLITLIQMHLKIPMTVLLVPNPQLQDYPLQNFYRSVFSPKYSSNDMRENSTSAYFTDLPRQHVLTVRVDVPEPWNVQATDAAQV